MNDLVFKSARKLATLLRTRKASAVEVTKAFIAQVERVNPKVNAIVTFLPEEALKEAKKVDDLTVDFILDKPNPSLPFEITSTYMVSKPWIEANGASAWVSDSSSPPARPLEFRSPGGPMGNTRCPRRLAIRSRSGSMN